MIFDLQKPIYGSTYAIWDKWLQIAKRKSLKLVVNTQFGTATFESASEYLREAKKIERFYKNPNEPMIFFARHFAPDVAKREKRKKLDKKEKQIIQDFSIPAEVMLRLKKVWQEKYGN